MIKSVPLIIGLRYIRTKRNTGFISFVSLFAMLGMTLGVFALIVVLSVMNGFDAELKSRILRVIPHGYLTKDAPLTDWPALSQRVSDSPYLQSSAPFIHGQGLVSVQGQVRGVEIQGVLPHVERDVSVVADFMDSGSMDDLVAGKYGVVMGGLLAQSLGLRVGDKVVLTLPQVSITPAGVFPRTKRFTVVGMFEVGAKMDESHVIMHLEDAQTLFRRGDAVDGLHLKFDDIYQAAEQGSVMAKQLGSGYEVTDWSQTQGSLFQAVKMEKYVTGVLLSIIIAVAAFNIVTSLVMMVAEKRSDIAVLRTLGLTRWGILRIFMIQGTAMGCLGVLIGVLLGIPVALYMSELTGIIEHLFGLQLFDPDVYFVASLPSLWQWQDTVAICLFSVLVSFLATLYPAYRASNIQPAEALRYDI